MKKKNIFLVFNILLFVTLIHIFYNFISIYQINNNTNHIKLSATPSNQNQIKYVQLLTGRFDYKYWSLSGLGSEAFKNCKEKRCYAIQPFYRQIALETSDAIIVHGPNLYNMPNRNNYKRNAKQIWMYYSMESPHGSYCSMFYKSSDLDDWFNLTATYKQESDFITDYKPGFKHWSEIKTNPIYIDEYNKLKKNYGNNTSNLLYKQLNEKNLKIIWIVSHCETSSRREDYIKKMMPYIQIDIYGNCGPSYFNNSKPIPCENNETFQKCFIDLINKYKFYLAFENSLCDDYITEKFWKFYTKSMIFTTNIVPIVKGAKRHQYEQLIMNNSNRSIIFADDFKSPKSLANYLNSLDSNFNDYLKYYEWKFDLFKELNSKNIVSLNNNNNNKYDEIIQSDVQSPFCYLCSMLHNETYMNSKTNKVWKLSEWFSVDKSCWDFMEKRRVIYWFTQLAGYCF